tara:strand:- start:2181 stop:2435 length:255 start_codon:yes stop_codon:yes gene_type:complete
MTPEIKPKVTDKELKYLTELREQDLSFKVTIGDLEIKKSIVLKNYQELLLKLQENEAILTEKYGKPLNINLDTGEIDITKAENE